MTRSRFGLRAGAWAVALGLGAAATGRSVAAPADPAAPAPLEPAAPLEKDELLALLRAVPGVSAKYREEQHISLLAAPLVSRGTMHFAPPGRLAKHQAEPEVARTVVAEGRLQFADAYGRDELELAKNPVVALFVDSFLQVLAGDVEAIERQWYVGFATGAGGDPRGWVLTLRPKAEAAARIIELLSIRGREAVVSRIEIIERGGDRTVTTMTDVDVARQWDSAAIADVFSVAMPSSR